MQPTWQALIDGARTASRSSARSSPARRPDVIVEDNVVAFPALQTAGKPFVRIVSCNPLEIRGPAADEIPPPYSGLPADDRAEWEAFREEYDRTHRPTWEDFDAWCREQGTRPLPELEFEHTSTRPEPVRLPAGRRLHGPAAARPATWRRLDSSVRATDAAFELPDDRWRTGRGLRRSIYLSLGLARQRRRRR